MRHQPGGGKGGAGVARLDRSLCLIRTTHVLLQEARPEQQHGVAHAVHDLVHLERVEGVVRVQPRELAHVSQKGVALGHDFPVHLEDGDLAEGEPWLQFLHRVTVHEVVLVLDPCELQGRPHRACPTGHLEVHHLHVFRSAGRSRHNCLQPAKSHADKNPSAASEPKVFCRRSSSTCEEDLRDWVE